VIFHTLSPNLCLLRVHEFVAREIPLLQSENLSLRFSTSSVQPLQAYVENSQKKARPKALASPSWNSASDLPGRTYTEISCPTLRPYASRVESPFSTNFAPLRLPTSALVLSGRAVGPGFRRTLLSVSGTALGVVSDGRQSVPSKSSGIPRSSASPRPGERAVLVSDIHDDPCLDTETHLRLGLRRHPGDHWGGYAAGLDRTAVPLPSHQPVAREPRTTQAQTGRQTCARDSLPAHPSSAGTAGRCTPAIGAQAAGKTRSETDGIARDPHGGSRVSEKDRAVQSVSEISGAQSANDYRYRRSYGTKSP
jgi:hypothetical protein